MKEIYQIFKKYKVKLLLIYVFMLVTELSILSQPFLLGKSIDGLLINSWFWVVFLSISYFLSDLFNYKRMVYDTKIYTKIYNEIVLKFLKKNNTSNSIKVARTDMAYQIVDVLEGYVHYYIATIVTIVGSIGFIYGENLKVGLVVSLCFVFTTLGVLFFYKKIRQSIDVRNNHYENKVKAIEKGYNESLSFFNRKRKLDIFESTLQGKNWFTAGIIKHLFLIIGIIVLVVTSENITIGGVIIIYSYVNSFLISLMSIPIGFEMYSRLNNILKRLE